jgi:50S ribosomal protein L16 3-hydroxylase
MNQFRFVPDARLDDLMISYATDGGGVGPHFDNYDVFLLQAHGKRRWRIGRQKDQSLLPDMPLKILANFVPEEEFVLEAGDMLYLPPRWAHDGIAEGECMTYSIGFRSPGKGELAREVLQRVADDAVDVLGESVYGDAFQTAVPQSARMPEGLTTFAADAVRKLLASPLALERALGEYMTEPKANVWFPHGTALADGTLHLDRRSRMLYDERHVFLNGESYVAAGRDATLMRKLADQRWLSSKDTLRLSTDARELVEQWCEDGWVYVAD